MKIYVLTPIYATTTTMQGATPVVHYFTKEWVKAGHQVTVFHLDSKYPRFYYWLARRFQHQLNTRLGMAVPTECPKDDDYVADGVSVCKRIIRKTKPHSRYSDNRINYAVKLISEKCYKEGVPDFFIGHWDNPQLEILCRLKEKFNKPTCLVLHSNRFDFERLYGEKAKDMLAQMDVIGFRNKSAQANFESKYGKPKSSFIAYSGVSKDFLATGNTVQRNFEKPIRNFIFVGSLIARKHPKEILSALSKVYPDGDFKVTYIGDGAEKKVIEIEHQRLGGMGEVVFTGRIPREDIIRYLKDSDVFVMVSRSEVFGLVYLEAMALGIIPIGSRNEGIDGIIRDGENGFLCEAGNVDELATIIERIKHMPTEELSRISRNARATAVDYSDKRVAEKYIETLSLTSVNKER